MNNKNFLEDLKLLSTKSKQIVAEGAVTKDYQLNTTKLIELLNSSFATETICALRYKDHSLKAKSLGARNAAAEFLEHSEQEQDHADKLLDRIYQLNGTANMNPEYIINNTHVKYNECNTLEEMINENLVAEQIAITTYRMMIQHIGDKDPTTRRIIEDILAVEEEHADDLEELKAEYLAK